MGTVTLKGNKCHISGELPAVGTAAPDFSLVDAGLADRSLSDYAGKKKLISIVPSLDTPVCALSTKKFNEYASQHSDAVILIVAADLPFAMARFCGAEGADNVVPLSMMRSKQFADDYGVMLTDGPLAGVTARAIVVLDENNQVIHNELVGEIGDEPDYEAALAALS
jgi:thiol peroxidase